MVAQRRIYVRDEHGKFAETGAHNKHLKRVARDLSTSTGTKLAQRVAFKQHGITNPLDQRKVLGHLAAMGRSRRRRAGTEQKVVKIGTGKKKYRVTKKG